MQQICIAFPTSSHSITVPLVDRGQGQLEEEDRELSVAAVLLAIPLKAREGVVGGGGAPFPAVKSMWV